MKDFTFHRPTKLIFGDDTIQQLTSLVPADAVVLMVAGGGSIKTNGVYDRVKAALHAHKVVEFWGIEPNPHYETSLKAIELARKEKATFVLAVGGGSVMDASKLIALATCCPEGADLWEQGVVKSGQQTKALPLGMVVTLPATGSEMNSGYVITNKAMNLKLAGNNQLLMPVFSILEPSVTLTLDARQTSNGIADAFVHVTEQYLNDDRDCLLQDAWSEGVLLALIDAAPKLMKNLQDITARRTVLHAATMALNGMTAMGVTPDWATHVIGHELTALYNTDHARTLTIVLPSLLRTRKEAKAYKLQRFAQKVWGITTGTADEQIAAGINATEAFFKSINMPVTLKDAQLPEEAVELVANRLGERGWSVGEDGKVDAAMVKVILTAAKG